MTQYLDIAASKLSGLDHAALIIDLLTVAYEQFKKMKHTRMTLYLASDIARIYMKAQKHDLSLRFFERIVKSYRKEGWSVIFNLVISEMIECAKKIGHWDVAVGGLIELCTDVGEELAASRWPELKALLWSPEQFQAKSAKDIVIDMDQINTFGTFFAASLEVVD